MVKLPKLFGRDLKNPKWIYLKGLLFLFMLVISFLAGLFEDRLFYRAFYLILLVWSSARFYYFAFYVIEKYVDPNYKFAGLMPFFLYLIRKR